MQSAVFFFHHRRRTIHDVAVLGGKPLCGQAGGWQSRALGAIVSVACLMILFDGVALASGYIGASFGSGGMRISRYADIVLSTMSAKDVWLTVAKGITFGAAVALFCSYHGLAVKAGPT